MSQPKKRRRPVTSAELSRYLKQLSFLNRDSRLGNPALSEALLDLSKALLDSKIFNPAQTALSFSSMHTNEDDESEFENLSSEQVLSAIDNADVTKSSLIVIGVERFGIPRSRMEKVSRDEVAAVIKSALEHEESLNIISEQARKGGADRSS